MGAVPDDAGIQSEMVRQASRRRCPELPFQSTLFVLWLPKNLAVRDWDCPQCNAHHDRDLNASINLKHEALRLLTVGSYGGSLVNNRSIE